MDLNSEAIKRAQPGVFLDVGAHHGQYTSEAAARHRMVYAFEPDAANLTRLRNNVTLLRNVIVVPYAVSDRDDATNLYACSTNPGGHTISKKILEGNFGHMGDATRVKCVTIDRFVADEGIADVTGMKIDVEGAELQVLEGARETLRRFDVKLALETHQTVDCAAVHALLREVGYRSALAMSPYKELRPDMQYLFERAP